LLINKQTKKNYSDCSVSLLFCWWNLHNLNRTK